MEVCSMDKEFIFNSDGLHQAVELMGVISATQKV